MEEN
jgi:centrosomal protein CEP76